jgi:hypothetical protein
MEYHCSMAGIRSSVVIIYWRCIMAEHKTAPEEVETGEGFPVQLKILLGIIAVALVGIFLKGAGVI